MRRKRLWRVRVRTLENRAVCGEGVDGWSRDFAVSVRRQVIGSERVDRDQDNGAVDWCRGTRIAPTANGSQPRAKGGESQNECETKRAGHGDLRNFVHVIFAVAPTRSLLVLPRARADRSR